MTELHRIELPLREPLSTARGPIMVRQGVLAVRRDSDVVALAEGTPHPDLSATEPEELYQSLAGSTSAGVTEREAVEAWLAVDHDSRRAGEPAAVRLTPHPLERVAVNGLLGRSAGPGEARALAERHHTIKVKVGDDSERAVARVAGIRAAVGPDVTIRVDANGAWSVAAALNALEALASLDVEYVEDPIPRNSDWRALRDCPVPLAIDMAEPPAEVLGVVDVVVLKPSMTTPRAAIQAAARARDHGADVVVTSIIDGAVGIGAALNMAAALGVERACGLATSELLARDVGVPPPIRDGSMELVRPGIGVVLDPDRLGQVAVATFASSSGD